MAETKHTPGPWVVRGTSVTIPYRGEHCCAEAFAGTIANARVIAAAPSLLEALQGLLIQAVQSELNDPANEWGYDAIRAARSALALAVGEG